MRGITGVKRNMLKPRVVTGRRSRPRSLPVEPVAAITWVSTETDTMPIHLDIEVDEPGTGAMEALDRVRSLVVDQNLNEANAMVLGLLEQRIADGDHALHAARILLYHYIDIISNLEPMAHLGCAPLRPDDRLVAAFSRIIDLMHAQNQQLSELQELASDLL